MIKSKNLQHLIEHSSCSHISGPSPSAVVIDGLTTDSRKVKKGFLFIVLRGEKSDGHDYIASAIESGCVAVLVVAGKADGAYYRRQDITFLSAVDTRRALADLAAAAYDFPQKELKFIGITGTNGKTTITYLLEKVLQDQGQRIGVIGTINYRYHHQSGKKVLVEAPFTTPEPLILQEILRRMADAGVSMVVMEVSSHALAQQRLGNIQFDITVFTNLTHDHLDYHRTMEEYFQAKSLLFFNHLKKGGKAVLTYKDSDDALENRWASALSVLFSKKNVDFVTCGRQKESIVQPIKIGVEIDRTEMSVLTPEGEFFLISPLVGRFNADNIITTLAVAAVLELKMEDAVDSLRSGVGVPGRLEKISLGTGESPKVVAFVDYAHTPDALLNVLSTLKSLPHNRLICVFGCGGDRDSSKRPEMGKIVAQFGDIAIVTEDNPRSEASDTIIRDIMHGIHFAGMEEKGCDWLYQDNGGSGCVVIADRRRAIQTAVHSAGEKDIVVIAGKGHETYQLSNNGRRYFDDSLEVREALVSWDMATVADALSSQPANQKKNRCFTGICTDSRTVQEHQIFVALRGESFDGHDYLDMALAKGAGGLVIEHGRGRDIGADTVPVYRVADTLEALGNLAHYRRTRIGALSGPLVVGITGSTGKTSVKEMVASIFIKRWPDSPLAPTGRVLKTSGNFNNLIGLPLSLLPLQLKHRAVILEMGMNQPGEISRLTEVADPAISCIVNVHGAHLQGLGSIEGVAREKEELFKGTAADGTLVVNLDDKFVRKAAAKYPQKKVKWTTEAAKKGEADVFATKVHHRRDGQPGFTLHIKDEEYTVNLRVPGMHNVANSLAAAAIAHAAGIEAEIIVAGLQSFRSAAKRLQVVVASAGYSILDDTYNANPESMAAGLTALADMTGEKKIAILGDMLELGDTSGDAHREIGRVAAHSGLAWLAVVGGFASSIAEGAVAAGLARDKIMVFSNKNDIPGWIHKLEAEGLLPEDTWMLIKASRGMRLETVVERLTTKE